MIAFASNDGVTHYIPTDKYIRIRNERGCMVNIQDVGSFNVGFNPLNISQETYNYIVNQLNKLVGV